MYLRNYKSRKKWQKAFINNVFKHKTKFHDTFSKIILHNIELIEEKTNHLPKSLFKFYTPTSDNIIDIKKQRLWMSHPRTFNDPFDCHAGYDVNSYEKHVLLKYIKESGCVDIKNSQDGFTIDEFNRLSRSTTSYEYNFYSKIEEYDTVLRKLLENKSKDFDHIIYDVIRKSRNEVKAKIEKLRNVNIHVASFSALDRLKGFKDIIHMWSHYADNHKGFCVEYDISPLKEPICLSLKDHEFYKEQSKYMDERIKVVILGGLFPVIYTASRVNITKTKLNKINFDEINGLYPNLSNELVSKITTFIRKFLVSTLGEWKIKIDRIPF